jgi:hypothetical protein
VDANTVIAICGVVIAVASLGVSAYVAWATRSRNRLSVRPLLGLTASFPAGGTAGSGPHIWWWPAGTGADSRLSTD